MSPKHVAIIMDGNRRWAKSQNLSLLEGYKKGVENLYITVENFIELKIKFLTVFGFSTENWNRSALEINKLMILFDSFLDESIEKIKSKNVKIRFIGDFSKFDKNIQDKINRLSLLSENNKGLTLTLAVNYGGRSDIVNAVNKLVCDKKSNKVDEKKFSKYIMNSDVPNPDLLIRTGSEKRLSNFLLWDLAYTELLFLNEMWPEFDMKLLKYSIKEFKKRIRNYGGNYV
tara:strand:+ start:118 stop:804 length:687 start_codon:yes stop_codon:yes gene_type:complete